MSKIIAPTHPLGASVYLSSFEKQKSFLQQLAPTHAPIFTSLHIEEEFSSDYPDRAREMCHWLRKQGFFVIADVSPKTQAVFGQDDMVLLARELQLSSLRLDYGFSIEQIQRISAEFAIVVNASTLFEDTMTSFLKHPPQQGISALHNYYPRVDTGLDRSFLLELNTDLHARKIEVCAFIAGNAERRGPLCEGLPTLERHRNLPPLVQFADLVIHCGVDQVFLGDLEISQQELHWITSFTETGILPIPAQLHGSARSLYDQVFSCRLDSPCDCIRFAESRGYASAGKRILPAHNQQPRLAGSITMDNQDYQRYSGEIQLLKADFPADPRVNIIGTIAPKWQDISFCIQRGGQFQLVEATI